jgi:hypothetical protein
MTNAARTSLRAAGREVVIFRSLRHVIRPGLGSPQFQDGRTALLADYRNRLLSLAGAKTIPTLDMANDDGLILKKELRPRIGKSGAPGGDPLRNSREAST